MGKFEHANQEKISGTCEFDINKELERVLQGVGLSQEDCGGKVRRRTSGSQPVSR